MRVVSKSFSKGRIPKLLVYTIIILIQFFQLTKAQAKKIEEPISKVKQLSIYRPDLPARILKFPDSGWAVGRIYIFRLYHQYQLFFLGDAIQDLGPARGLVKVPKGRCAGMLLAFEGVHKLEALKNLNPNDLQYIVVHSTPFTTENIKMLHHLKGLERLNLNLTQIDDNAPIEIAKFPNLRSVSLSSNGITNKNLSALNTMKKLAILKLNHTEIGDEGVKVLSNNRSLYSLAISDTKTSSKCVDYLVKMKQLKILKMIHDNLDDAAVLKLAQMKNLLVLEIGEDKVTNKGIEAFKKLKPNCRIYRKNEKFYK